MKTLQQSISEQTQEALKDYRLLSTLNFHDHGAPEGNTLSEKLSVYILENSYAIKQEIFDVDSYGLPEVTNLDKFKSKEETIKYLTEYISTDPREIFLNNSKLTGPDQIINSLNYNPYINTETNMDSKITVSGFVGTKFNYNLNEETKKSVISLTIKPSNGDWVHVKAFNQNADLLKIAIEKEDIKKFTITGKMKDAKPYVNSKGETVQYQELVADSINRHKTVEINGVIAKVDEKETSKNKPYTHVFVKNNVSVGGVETVEQFNVTIFKENKKGIPSDVDIKVGQPIAVKGEATINRYLDKDNNVKESTTITAWNIDKTPTRLKEQVKNLQENSAKEKVIEKTEAKEQKKEPKAAPKKTSSKKGKDTGIDI